MGHNRGVVGSPYDDPHFQPATDITGADARAYEERIVSLLTEAMAAWLLKPIELRGERPNTEIIFRVRERERDRRYKFALWKSEYPTDGAAEFGSLHEAASVAGWVYSDWTAGDLAPLDDGD
jgi:hypothetical protein